MKKTRLQFIFKILLGLAVTSCFIFLFTNTSKAGLVTIDCSVDSPKDIAQGTDFFNDDDLVLEGNGTCVLTNTATLGTLVVGDINETDATILTHPGNADAQTYTLNISTDGDATIYGGASINVDGKGYNATYGPGSNGTGNTGGAGYGGDGGSHTDPGGSAYCDISVVDEIGSGGGAAAGGSGGGLISLNVSGTLTVDGTLTANGSYGTVGGGGSGGGIYLTAPVIAGTPTAVSVIGGAGLGRGGGGGGCMLIEYTTSNTIDGDSVAMHGAISAAENGGAGQVWVFDTDSGTNDSYYIINDSAIGAKSPTLDGMPATLEVFNVDDYAHFEMTSSLNVTEPTLTTNSIIEIELGSTFTYTSATIGDDTGRYDVSGILAPSVGNITSIDDLIIEVQSGGEIINGDPLTVQSGATFILRDGAILSVNDINTLTSYGTLILENNTLDVTGTVTIGGGTASLYNDFYTSLNTLITDGDGTIVTLYDYTLLSPLALSTLTVKAGSTLIHGANSTAQTHVLSVDAVTMTIESGATVSADSKGYAGDYGPGTGGGSGNTGGAGYGGDGGSWTDPGGSAYCDISAVDEIGSGGGGVDGGSGGGLISLDVSGTLTVNGTLTADGGYGTGGGGGSGGGIYLDALVITGTPTAISIIGGAGVGRGGGGGGCMLIRYTTSNTIAGDSVAMHGAISAAENGGAGQVRVYDTDSGADDFYYIINDSALGAKSPTLSGMPAALDSLTVDNYAWFEMTSSLSVTDTTLTTYSTIKIEAGDTFTYTNTITGDDTGTFDVYGTFTPSVGTIISVDDLIIEVYGTGTLNNGDPLTVQPGATLTVHDGATLTDPDLSTITSYGTLYLENDTLGTVGTININGGTAALFNAFFTTLDTMVLDSGTTILYDYTVASPMELTTVTMNTGSILTHAVNTNSATENPLQVLSIDADTMTINSGAVVDVDGKGYLRDQGPGKPPVVDTYGGAGHGGDGGDAGAQLGGVAYCDINTVDTVGSGGGRPDGGTGGGLIYFVISGTLTVEGTLSADGANANAGGGGSGGGIHLIADIVESTSPDAITYTGGGAGGGSGGGGCMLVTYATSNDIAVEDVDLSAGVSSWGVGYDGDPGLFKSDHDEPPIPPVPQFTIFIYILIAFFGLIGALYLRGSRKKRHSTMGTC